MLHGLSVPTHRIDAPGVLILAHDDAWDAPRIVAERDELVAQTLAAKRGEAREAAARQALKGADELTDDERATADASVVLTVDETAAARARHPFDRYIAGATRFDLQAIDQGPRGPARAVDYLRPDATPTMIHLRRVGYAARARLDPMITTDPIARWAGWIRAGVERITCGADVLWQATREAPELPEAWIERLTEADGGPALNLIAVAGACARYSAPLDKAEHFRCA